MPEGKIENKHDCSATIYVISLTTLIRKPNLNPQNEFVMEFSTPLIRGTLIKRYKRFLADVTLDSGKVITAHCPNTGSMLSCSTPGSPVCLSISDNPKRKYPYSLEMVMDNDGWVGVNTSKTNSIVAEAIEACRIAQFQDVLAVKKEVKTSAHNRLDLHITHGQAETFMEIKNCSLAIDRCAMFPDAVTARGAKHLEELMRLVEQGRRSCIFFLVQRMDADSFSPAGHIDPHYAASLERAMTAGVLALAYQAEVNPNRIEVVRQLEIRV